jgi:hypothetical protein
MTNVYLVVDQLRRMMQMIAVLSIAQICVLRSIFIAVISKKDKS